VGRDGEEGEESEKGGGGTARKSHRRGDGVHIIGGDGSPLQKT